MALGGLGVRLVDLTRLYARARARRADAGVHRARRAGAVERRRRITEPVAAWYVFDALRGSPPPDAAPPGRLAYKTGTSYGYRDALAIGFDRRMTIGVWVGRADNAPAPGLVGRKVAAPILFDAFARAGGAFEPIPAPRDALVATTGNLPPPLRTLRKDAPKTVQATSVGALRIAYPPDGARVDLDLAGAATPLALKAEGGALPLIWMVNGAPIGAADLRRATVWRPDGAGFARVSVLDARGASDSVTVRVE